MISYTKSFGMWHISVSPYGITLQVGTGGWAVRLCSLSFAKLLKPPEKGGNIIFVEAENPQPSGGIITGDTP